MKGTQKGWARAHWRPRLLVGAKVLVALAWGFPTLWAFGETFLNLDNKVVPTLSNIVAAWKDAPYERYALNTAIIVLGLLASQLVFGAVVGFVLARYQFPGKSWITGLFLVQIIVPIYAILVPEYEIIRAGHLLNTLVGIMLPYAVSGIAVLAFRQVFRNVPRELEEAARLDGYGTVGVFRRVYLPQALPAAIAVAVVSATYHWTDFLWPLIVTNTNSARPIVVGLAMVAQSSESGVQWNLLAASTIIVVAPVLVVFVLTARRVIKSFVQSFNW